MRVPLTQSLATKSREASFGPPYIGPERSVHEAICNQISVKESEPNSSKIWQLPRSLQRDFLSSKRGLQLQD
jgi:hypothetical protein